MAPCKWWWECPGPVCVIGRCSANGSREAEENYGLARLGILLAQDGGEKIWNESRASGTREHRVRESFRRLSPWGLGIPGPYDGVLRSTEVDCSGHFVE